MKISSCAWRFGWLCSVIAIACIGCGDAGNEHDGGLGFAVLDVGQGLSQVGVSDGRAFVWDIGPRDSFERWSDGYDEMGRPPIDMLVLSHSDEDHRGGLAALGPDAGFSGTVVMSVYEDTSLVRRCGGAWASRLSFRTIAAGDTLGGLDGVYVECLWPPRGRDAAIPVGAQRRNELSLVFRIVTGDVSLLITSDIDSAAERELVSRYGLELASDIVVVPHHGSAGSVNRRFYGSVMPSWAVVSCGARNDYGHPSGALIDMLFDLGIELLSTPAEGHVRFHSNGVYWTRVYGGGANAVCGAAPGGW